MVLDIFRRQGPCLKSLESIGTDLKKKTIGTKLKIKVNYKDKMIHFSKYTYMSLSALHLTKFSDLQTF